MLSQAEIGVIVADRDGKVVFSNEYVGRLLRLPGAGLDARRRAARGPRRAAGQRAGRAAEIARQVLSGVTWEDTFAGHRADGSLLFVRELAVPLRNPSGEIDGIVMFVTRPGGAARSASRTGCGCSSGSASGWPGHSSLTPRCAR